MPSERKSVVASRRVAACSVVQIDEQKYLSISQASKLLGVSRPTIYARIKAGELKAVRISTNTIRIPLSQLEAQPVRYSPSPKSIRDIEQAKKTMITRDEAIAKYDISQPWFYKKVKGAGIKAMRFGTKAYYPKDEIHRLFFKNSYPDVKEWISSEELAAKFGHTRKYICDQARQFNVPRVRTGRSLMISKLDWDKNVIDVPDLQKHYLTVEQAKKLYHIGQSRFYDEVNAAGLERRRQGREVFFRKTDLDRLFKDKSPKIPEYIRRDYITAKEALAFCHVGQKRFSEDTKAAGATKIRTEGNFVWYNKEELRRIFNL